MATHAAHVRDVTDAEFAQAVLARSAEVPVLVDFWAPWCGPCRALGPVLERLAGELAGAFELVKVNTDENPAMAGRYRVRGIPHVLLFKDGEAVDQFVGALPEPQVRAFLHKHCPPPPSPSDTLVAEAGRLLEQGDLDRAQGAFEQALAADPACHAAHLGLARLALRRRDVEAVAAHVGRIPAAADQRAAADYVQQAAALVREVTMDRATAERRVQAQVAPDAAPDTSSAAPGNAGDVEAWFALGVHELADGRYRAALDAFLAVAERQRKWRDEAARKAMLVVFGMIGVRDPLADEYRRKLMFIY